MSGLSKSDIGLSTMPISGRPENLYLLNLVVWVQVMEQCLINGAMKETSVGDNGEAMDVNSSKRMATLRAASQVSHHNRIRIKITAAKGKKLGPNQIRTSDLSDCSRLLYH